ncbi:FAD-dependent oxidoreductase [Chloroflexota bacterium]
MNFYEADIIRTQQRIKKIEESPDPTRLKSNKIRYEARLKSERRALDIWRQGKPFSECLMSHALAVSMGLTHIGLSGATHSALDPQRYLEKARSIGLPVEHACDLAYIGAGMIECGDMPAEVDDICGPYQCNPRLLQRIFMLHHEGKYFNYCFDVPFEENEAGLEYLVSQYYEFIEFAEKNIPPKGSLFWRLAAPLAKYFGKPSLIRFALGLNFPIKKRVAIIGGQFAGCELALELSQKGKEVTVIEESKRIGNDIGIITRWVVMKMLRGAGVKMETLTTVSEIINTGVKVRREDSSSSEFVAADTVLIAMGVAVNTKLAQELAGTAPVIYSIGDGASPGRVKEAIESGFNIGSKI